MKYLVQNPDGSFPDAEDFSKTQEEKLADTTYEIIANQIKSRFPNVKAIIADVDSLRIAGAVPGDIIYCPHRLGEPAMAWILRNPDTGEGELLGSGTIENLEWFTHFGPLELLMIP
jgi:hypothetical protein